MHVDLKCELANICPDLMIAPHPPSQPPVDIHEKCISTSGGVLRNLHRSILGLQISVELRSVYGDPCAKSSSCSV